MADDMMDSQLIKNAWLNNNNQYGFAQACYQEGIKAQIAKLRAVDPELNAVLHVIEHNKCVDHDI
jgi:hypothetical protein